MDGATRIWLDDPNPIYRMGLAASLRDSRFVVVGESAGFVPPPALEDVDVLVFDLGEQSARPGCTVPPGATAARTRLVGLVPGGDADAVEPLAVHRSRPFGADARGLPPLPRLGGGGSVGPAAGAGRSGQPAGRSGPPGRCRDRVRRLMARKGALFAVVVALGAGVFGPSGKADGLGPGVRGARDDQRRRAHHCRQPGGGDGAGAVGQGRRRRHRRVGQPHRLPPPRW